MKNLISLPCQPIEYKDCALSLYKSINEGLWVQLMPDSHQQATLLPQKISLQGPGVAIQSGGSSGGKHYCFQPIDHLNQSALATSEWLKLQGIEPQNCIILNPLPLHHISGLMPWWRSQCWKSEHIWLLPKAMRDPVLIKEIIHNLNSKPILISLVPTQLKRLLSHKIGINLLKLCDIIWVGGAHLNESIAKFARTQSIRLAPCYGATETAAMITAMHPQDFLKGESGCGSPLGDIDLTIGENNSLKIKTSRLAVARWSPQGIERITNKEGWWQSGDSAQIINLSKKKCLIVKGRLDNAINSGGETIFPEQLEEKLLGKSKKAGLKLESVLLLPIKDDEWGERIVALIRWEPTISPNELERSFRSLQNIVAKWMKAEQPVAWHNCPELSPNKSGKWERNKWLEWLKLKS
ncbi:AMP-binding protein [Prochlorococcus sp. MIT 1300]|uniref:AMP-binding protein n=1 Tax=Prochlorococcus sp. MIT 1300 TaxID=3096218 RepID=UPI002A758C85|nr:AMP-binding protein [Prochlorococcus sp. MIT 1300]